MTVTNRLSCDESGSFVLSTANSAFERFSFLIKCFKISVIEKDFKEERLKRKVHKMAII